MRRAVRPLALLLLLLSSAALLPVLTPALGAPEQRLWVDGAEVLAQARGCLSSAGLSESMLVVVQPAGTYVSDSQWRWETRLLSGQDRSQRVRVELFGKDRPLQAWTVVFQEPSVRSCVFAAHDIPAGTLLRESDLCMGPEPRAYHPVVCRGIEDAVGRTLASSLAAGKVVPQRALVWRPVYRRGDRVSIHLVQDGISVELTGTAIGSAYPGREFRMKSASGKLMTVYLDIEGRPYLSQGAGL